MNIQVPMLDLAAQHDDMREEIRAAIDEVFMSQKFIMGKQVMDFEHAAADYFGCRYAVGVASGTDALTLALRALDIGPGDEVIVPAFTFFGTFESVMHVGATPVFVDICADTYCMDVDQAGELVGMKTKAMIPVHLFGHPADMWKVAHLADRHDLKVIEDNAQAFGAKHRGQLTGTIGDIGCLSFFPSKNLGGCGDGGMVLTGNEQVADKLRMLRVHGWKRKNHPEMVGYNSRLDTIQAAILGAKLPRVDDWNDGRRRCAERYDKALGNVDLTLPVEKADAFHVYNQYVVRSGHRQLLQRELNDHGIGNAVYYPAALPQLGPCAGYVQSGQRFPEAERAAREVLAIPIFPGMTLDQQKLVVRAIIMSLHQFS